MDLLTLSMAKKYTDESILGTDGINKGEKGDKGDPGYTPVRGVDYWTEDDKAIIMSENSPAIICEKTGDVIVVNDSSDRLLKGLIIYGKTTQDGIPTPENPISLETVGTSGTINVFVGVSVDDIDPKTLTVSTPNGLPGVSVSSGGNYTDENGRQWICDEIDYTKGVRLQRIGLIESYAEEVITGAYMSSTGELTNGATVLYVLATPIETSLSTEEMTAFAALHTNKPTTTVYNDAGADLAVEYVADTKNYIDQKLAAISAALLNA